jgi:hypothetical protein
MVHGQQEFITLLAAPISQYFWLLLKQLPYLIIGASLIFITGCAAPLVAISSTSTSAASTVGAAALANPSTAASLTSTATTGKSPLEHAASAATKKECSFFNVIGSKPICVEVTPPKVTDKSEPFKGLADISPEAGKQ